MSTITNNYAEGSCIFEAGSSQNGDVTISTVYQGAGPDKTNASGPEGSPIHLSGKKGVKIDLIRVMNAWYECGKVQDALGGRLTKKQYFEAVGRAFNIDLSSYDKDLSTSMSSSVAYEKQIRIFDELREKHESIYNSKCGGP